MKDKEQIENLAKKLNVIIALLLLKDFTEKNTKEKIELLNRFNLNNEEISQILGTTKGTVEVTKSRISKKSK